MIVVVIIMIIIMIRVIGILGPPWKLIFQLKTGVYVTLWNDRRKYECSRYENADLHKILINISVKDLGDFLAAFATTCMESTNW